MSETVTNADGRASCCGFTEDDIVTVDCPTNGPLGRGILVAILGRTTNHPAARVNLDGGNSWEGGFDSLTHAAA